MTLFGHDVDDLFPELPKEEKPKESKRWTWRDKIYENVRFGESLKDPEEEKISKAPLYVPGGSYINFEDPSYSRDTEYAFSVAATDMMEEVADLDEVKEKMKRSRPESEGQGGNVSHADFYHSVKRLLKQLPESGLEEITGIQKLLDEYHENMVAHKDTPADALTEEVKAKFDSIEEKIDKLIEEMGLACADVSENSGTEASESSD